MSYYEQRADNQNYFYFYSGPRPNTTPHFHSASEFLFVEKGKQEVIVGGEKRILSAGDACFVDSFCVHSYPNPNAVSATVIVGDKQYFERAFSCFQDKRPPRFFRFENFSLLRSLQAIYDENSQNAVGRYAVFAGILGILFGAIAENTAFVSLNGDKQDALVCDILRYTESHLQEDLSLRVISHKFGYSYEHLSRLLHKYLSEHWTAHLNRLRVKRVKTLLEADPKTPVLSLAFSCGFESANTFYRAYKKEFGAPPRS